MALDRPDTNEKINGSAVLRDDLGLPRDAYSLLAQANLFRMRGCWEEAVDNCMAVLRLAPDSSSAQSLLGDIYENQGRFDDAIQWYRMALDASPDSPADRIKLDRLLQRQQTPSRSLRPSSVEQNTGITPPLPRRESLDRAPLFRLRRLRQDPETALRYSTLVAAALVLFIVAFAYVAVHRHAALAALGLGSGSEVQIQPVMVPPASVAPTVSEANSVPRDVAEQAVLDSLRGASDLSAQGISVLDVQSDPRTGRLSVTIGLSSADGLTRTAVLRSALHTVQDAAVADPASTLLTIRCLMLPADSAVSGTPTRVFLGDTAREVLPDPTAAEPDDAHVQALFTNVWWSSQLPI